jgi:hypothetical protein
MRESVLIFTFTFAAYFALGYWLTVDMKVVPFDSAFRLLHAYSTFYNDPPKLAAIGFVWPPLMTLTYLPFVLIKPIATSLVAIPLYSAFFGAATLAALNRLLGFLEVPRIPRYLLVLAFGANPMIVHYATNGMSEILVAFLTVVTIDEFLRWKATKQMHHLALCGLAMSLGLLSRYELAPFALALMLAVCAVLVAWRVRPERVESSLLLYAAPIAYGIGAWVFFNWLVIGNPFHFLGQEVSERFVAETHRTVAQGGAGGAQATSAISLIHMITSLNWRLFAPMLVVVPMLLILALVRRDLIALVIAGLALLNPITTYFAVKGSDLSLLQLRFNMRSMPIVIIGIGWIVFTLHGRWRWAAALVGAIGVALAAPLTMDTMKTYPYVFVEHDFVAAIENGKVTDPVDVAHNQKMADYILAHVHRGNSVLVDDAQVYMPLILSGHPDLFFDRIDQGDQKWLVAADDPIGHVDWLLMPRESGPIQDLLLEKYPKAPEGKVPFLKPRFATGNVVLLRVVNPQTGKPGAPAAGVSS